MLEDEGTVEEPTPTETADIPANTNPIPKPGREEKTIGNIELGEFVGVLVGCVAVVVAILAWIWKCR